MEMDKVNLNKIKLLLTEAYKTIPDISPTSAHNQLAEAGAILDNLIASIDSCETHGCSYYTHYLVYFDPSKGDPQLVHEAFHQAEKYCENAHKQWIEWMDNHANDGKPIPPSFERWANYWERKVCA